MSSYLADRYQSIKIGDALSSIVKLLHGVPQGSVLEPLLFTMYTAPLATLMKKAGIMYHSYADDTQVYLSFQPGCVESESFSRSKVESALSIIKSWMTINMLKLNEDKTEVMVISSKVNLVKNNITPIIFEDIPLQAGTQAKDLGVIF